jgi:hypothetical protein
MCKLHYGVLGAFAPQITTSAGLFFDIAGALLLANEVIRVGAVCAS